MIIRKPRKAEYWPNGLFITHPWTAKVWDEDQNSCQTNHPTLAAAIKWAESYVFRHPTWREITGNGRWGCD